MEMTDKRHLRHDRRGNVAILAGLLAVPLLGLTGLAMDFGTATATKAQLDLAADAAALLATTSASNAYLAGASDPITSAQTAAARSFKAQSSGQVGVSISAVTVSVLHPSGTLFSADVSYQGVVQTTLGRLFGVLNLAVNGRSSSSLSINLYVDIQVLMDVSSSMTIAATQADIARMESLTSAYSPVGKLPGNVAKGEKCAFACHWTATGDDYYGLAQRSNVPLRIDVLRDAVKNLISNVDALNTHSAFRLGLYTFAQAFTQIYPLSLQISAATAALSQISPDVNECKDDNSCPETYFSNAMSSLTLIAGTSGDGGSPATSQKFLFIVTDGLVDQKGKKGRELGPVDTADCDTVKAKGITILTLYTPYLPLLSNDYYVKNVAPIQMKIGPSLPVCATSPTLYFQAANASDVDAQLRLMLASVLQTSGHLTR